MRTVFLGEEDVVVLSRVERRVEIDQIDRLVLHIALEDFVVVAVIKLVFVGGHGIGLRLAQRGSAQGLPRGMGNRKGTGARAFVRTGPQVATSRHNS